eukprot:TRINITY_DN2927_c0_g1_i1.p1 TRINITY_DN2927_c0_g1~~TRINITY_DN2927_c0_g1_i1.p1  ORF type:complete len:623 (+),score=91.87 TRINITY_DN2927_c0_g1_i1:97-1965(+)
MKTQPKEDTSSAALILQRLLAEEAESLSRIIYESHLELATRFDEHVAHLVGQPALYMAEDATVPTTANELRKGARAGLENTFATVTSSRVIQPPLDASLPPAQEGLDGHLEDKFRITAAEEAAKPSDMLPARLDGANRSSGDAESYNVLDSNNLQATLAHALEQEVIEDGVNRGTSSTSSGRMGKNTKLGSIRQKSQAIKSMPWMRRLILSPVFESAFACLIFFNAICMGLEQQYMGFDAGYRLRLPGYGRNAKETWPVAETALFIAETFFGVVFTVEVVAKVVVFRIDFFKSLWNIYDSVIIVCWLVQNLSVFDIFLPPLVMRLARMGRLLRLLRFAKAFQVFDVLHLLVRSMMACMPALLWSMLFLSVLMMGTAILLVYLLQQECENPAISEEGRLLMFTYFGNFTKGMFSVYELTMGNWVPISRTVIENVSDWYMFFFLSYRTLVGFAVLKVITAIFNAETFRITQSDDGIMLLHKERQITMHTKRMEELLVEGDKSQDGHLSLDEFEDLVKDEHVHKWLAAQEIELKDVELAFKMIDVSGDNRVSAEELVRGLARLKGAARSVDVVTLMHAFRRLEVIMDRIDDCLFGRPAALKAQPYVAPLAPVLHKSVAATFLKRV